MKARGQECDEKLEMLMQNLNSGKKSAGRDTKISRNKNT
jgi:hypothetical protein